MARVIDLNRARVEDLMASAPLDRATALLIIDQRERSGSFKDLTDIKGIPGVSDGTVTHLREAGFYIPGEREPRDHVDENAA